MTTTLLFRNQNTPITPISTPLKESRRANAKRLFLPCYFFFVISLLSLKPTSWNSLLENDDPPGDGPCQSLSVIRGLAPGDRNLKSATATQQ